jgi:hypothetical protein
MPQELTVLNQNLSVLSQRPTLAEALARCSCEEVRS